MIHIQMAITPKSLEAKLHRLFELSAVKISSLESSWDPSRGSPVFTSKGKYTSHNWTDWTQGFQFGAAILQYDATGEQRFLEMGRNSTVAHMTSHLTNMGSHDHGFNTVSTYGNLLRMMQEGKIDHNAWEQRYYELALKCSGAVQAARWSATADGGGYIYSFNGAHSLFVDTIRSLRALALSHRLGHYLLGGTEQKVSLLQRLIEHARSTARYAIYYGTGRDIYDVRGRVAHESLFNPNGGSYRCPSTQQGYSPFSTWTRGLAWTMLGFAEQIEFIDSLRNNDLAEYGGRNEIRQVMLKAAQATCDFYIENTPADGIPYWDTGAPGLAELGDWKNKDANPFNLYEPVDSSAASIAAQGLLRLGHSLNDPHYSQAGFTVCETLFDEPYVSLDPNHQGLILHSVYHRPNGWGSVDRDDNALNGESSMWGDYHALELALYVLRVIERSPYLVFWPNDSHSESL